MLQCMLGFQQAAPFVAKRPGFEQPIDCLPLFLWHAFIIHQKPGLLCFLSGFFNFATHKTFIP